MDFIRAFLFVLVSLTSFLWAKTSYYILPVHLKNVHEDYAEKIVSLTKEYVAVEGDEVLGYSWNVMSDGEDSDCEIIALYVRYSKRKSGIGRSLMENAMESFRRAGKKSMIIWCLEDNLESRKFYGKMGGNLHGTGTHRWGDRDYNMVSYLYKL